MRLLIIVLFLIFFPLCVQSAGLANRLSGQILLSVEENGEAWYIYPKNNKRYFLGRPDDAFKIMRELGLGISDDDFLQIKIHNSTSTEINSLEKKLSGMIVLEVEKNGEAWYINPKDYRKYYLGRPDDAFKIMRELSLGINRIDLAKIHKPELFESINIYSKYYQNKFKIKNQDFTAEIIEIDLSNPKLEIITDTAMSQDCDKNCEAKTLGDYIIDNNAFAGINGSYFDAYVNYNYYFAPIYKSNLDKMINADQLKYFTTGPMIVFDKNNKYYYFRDCREFKSQADFEAKYNTKIQAAIGNKPILIDKGQNLLIDWEVDDKQRNVKAPRNALAIKDNKVFLIVLYNSTLYELANLLKDMKVEYALNLDGGYSASLWYNDEYMVGPGRDIPNAIIFREKSYVGKVD